MRLENEADVAPDLDKLRVAQAGQFAPQNAEAPLLNVAKAADEREESCLTAAGGPGHDDQFPRLNGQIDPEEDLIAQLAGTEVVVQAGDLESLSIVFVRHGRTPLQLRRQTLGVQNTSAGAALQSFLITRQAEITHMSKVNAKTNRTRNGLKINGMLVMLWLAT